MSPGPRRPRPAPRAPGPGPAGPGAIPAPRAGQGRAGLRRAPRAAAGAGAAAAGTKAAARAGRSVPVPVTARCPVLTLDGDDVLADLALQRQVLHALDEVVDRVDIGVHGLEAPDLGADRGRVGEPELRRGRPAGLRPRGPGHGHRHRPARRRQALLLPGALPGAAREVHRGGGTAGQRRGAPGSRCMAAAASVRGSPGSAAAPARLPPAPPRSRQRDRPTGAGRSGERSGAGGDGGHGRPEGSGTGRGRGSRAERGAERHWEGTGGTGSRRGPGTSSGSGALSVPFLPAPPRPLPARHPGGGHCPLPA